MTLKKILVVGLVLIESYLVSSVDHPDGKSSVSHQQDELGNYQFGYTVSSIDGEHFHKASKDALGRVVGSYGLIENDGRHRVVDYVADHDGFRANIRSNEPGLVSSNSAALTVQNPNSGLAPVVVANSVPVIKPNPRPPLQNLDFAASDTAVTSSDSSSSDSSDSSYGDRLGDRQSYSKVTYSRPYEEEARRRVPLRRPRLENVPNRSQRRQQNQRLRKNRNGSDTSSDTIKASEDTLATQEQIEHDSFHKQNVPLVRIHPNNQPEDRLNRPSLQFGHRVTTPITPLSYSLDRVHQTDNPITYRHHTPVENRHHFPRRPEYIKSSAHARPNAEFSGGHSPSVSMSTIHGGFTRSPYVPDRNQSPHHNPRPIITQQRGAVTAPIPGARLGVPPKDSIVRAVAIPNGIQALRVDPSTGEVYDTAEFPIYNADDKHHRSINSREYFGPAHQTPRENGKFFPDDDEPSFQYPPQYGYSPFQRSHSYNSKNSSEVDDRSHLQNLDPSDDVESRLSRPSARDLALISRVFNDIGHEYKNGIHAARQPSQINNKPNLQTHFPIHNFETTIPAGFYGPSSDFSDFRKEFGARLPDFDFDNERRPSPSPFDYPKRDFDYPLFDHSTTNLQKVIRKPDDTTSETQTPNR